MSSRPRITLAALLGTLAAVLGTLSACGGGGSGGSAPGGGAPRADLVVDLVTFAPSDADAGTGVGVSDTVSNVGAAAASAVRVGLYLSSDATITSSDRLLGFRTLAQLDAGATSAGGGTLTIPASTAAGDWWIGAIADDVGTIVESSETNNARAAASVLHVHPAVLPDLEVFAVATTQSSAQAGGPLPVTDTVVNAGSAAAGAFQVAIYLSSDSTVTPQDVLLGTRAVASLAAGAQSSAADALVVPPTIAAGTWWLGAIVDPEGQVAEIDELDNVRVATAPLQVSVPPRPNLGVSAFSFAPLTADAGTPITVQDTVANTGPGAAGSFVVAVRLSSDAQVTHDDVLLGTRTVAALASGTSDSSSGQLVIPADVPAGTYWVGAIADDALAVPETNEADNVRTAPVLLAVTVPPRPDLVPQSLSFTPATIDTTVGQVLHLSESVANTGTAVAGAFRVGLYLSSNNVLSTGDVLLASRTVNGLAIGASSGAQTDVALPAGVGAGTWYVGVIVDDLQAQLELHEADDALLAGGTLDVVASPLPQPNLVVHSVSFTPATAHPGDAVQVLDEVRNEGTLSAGAFRVGIYLSSDDTIATDDLRIGGRTVLQLGIGFGSASSAPIVLPSSLAPGTYRLGAIVDDLDQVVESQELDNSLRATGTLVVALQPPPLPDLRVTAASITPTTAAVGATVQCSMTVTNAGDLDSGAFRVAFYASSDATVSAQDTLLGFQSLAALGPNQGFTGTFGAVLPALAPGTYTIGAFVDDQQLVVESVETNNVLVAAATLHVP